MADGPQQQGRHEARQGPGEQGHHQQKRQISQHGGVAQGDQGRRHLADVVARRAAGDAETAEELRRRYPRLNLTTWSKENRLQF